MSEMIKVPDGWEVKPFSDLATINMGQSPESEFVNENQEGIAFLQGNADFGDVNPKELYWVTVPKKIAKKDDILISVRAPVGDMNIADKDYCIGRGLSALTIKKIDKKFGFYALFQERIQLGRLAQGSTFLAIGKNDFDKLLIKYPKEKKEQEKIAKILSTLDKAIETTNRLIEKEKNIKKALMQELLTNGIDKDGHIRTRATHTYKESELGLIPDEWEIVSLGQITKIVGGGTPSRDIEEYWKNGTIPWVTVKDLHDGLLIKESEEYITEKGLQSSATNLIEANNIITSTRMGIGRFYINEVDVTINQDMKALFAKDNIDKQFFLWSLLLFGKKLEVLGTGTTVKGILLEDLKSLKLILPSMTEQKQIAKILTTQDKKIATEETNLAKLGELKKGLMNDLLSGKVRAKI